MNIGNIHPKLVHPVAQVSAKFFWRSFNMKKARSFGFAVLRRCISRKKDFIQADRALKIKQFYNQGR